MSDISHRYGTVSLQVHTGYAVLDEWFHLSEWSNQYTFFPPGASAAQLAYRSMKVRLLELLRTFGKCNVINKILLL